MPRTNPNGLHCRTPCRPNFTTSAWATLKSRFGWQATRAVVGSEDAPIRGTSILLRRAAGVTLAYVPAAGPVVDWGDPEAVARW